MIKKKETTGTDAAKREKSEKLQCLLVFAAFLLSLGGLVILYRNAAPQEILLSIAAPSVSGILLQQTDSAQENEDALKTEEKIAAFCIEKLQSDPDSLQPDAHEPQILIYHTHTTEAYNPTKENPYTEDGGSWRTYDNDCNIVAVGEELAHILREDYGFGVIHDTTDHEPPKLASAYSRSEVTMKAYRDQYPSLKIFIDVHRDAYGTSGGEDDDALIDGRRVARLMFVVGTGKGATGTGFEEMPDFESNYAWAKTITEKLNRISPDLAREIRVKTGRYNQHVSTPCLLVEVGHNKNTLEEALNAIPYLASAIAAAAKDGAMPQTAEPVQNVLSLLPD